MFVLDGSKPDLRVVKGGKWGDNQPAPVGRTTRLKKLLDELHLEAGKKRQRVYIEMDNFLNVTYVRAQIGRRFQSHLFLDDVEQFGGWMIREDRIKFVAVLLAYGYRVQRMALMLGFSTATIYADIRWMREHKPNMLINADRVKELRTKFDYANRHVTGKSYL